MFSRTIWLVLCIGSLLLCGYIIAPIYTKWQNNPTITSIASTNYAIWNIHFPAVTICSNNKVVKKNLMTALKQPP